MLAPLGALLMALTVSVGAALAAGSSSCLVSVEPLAAAAGSAFVFTGSGFHPTRLTLQKEVGAPIVNDLSVADTDPWQVTVSSRPGDEGSWTATFEAEGGCIASVEFRVMLSNTDMITDVLSQQLGAPVPVLLYLLVIGFGFSGGVFLARRLDAGRRV